MLVCVLKLMNWRSKGIGKHSTKSIPKEGNLKVAKNYRGVQMMKSLACLYGRILANRLKLWLPVNDDQTIIPFPYLYTTSSYRTSQEEEHNTLHWNHGYRKSL